jgi:phenylacetate-CoA ligase
MVRHAVIAPPAVEHQGLSRCSELWLHDSINIVCSSIQLSSVVATRLPYGECCLDHDQLAWETMDIARRESHLINTCQKFIQDSVIAVGAYEKLYLEQLKLSKYEHFERWLYEEIRSTHDLSKLPALTPFALKSVGSPNNLLPTHYLSALSNGNCRELKDPLIKRFTSSGSTGKPKVTYYSLVDWLAALDLIQRSIQWINTESPRRVFSTFNQGHIGGPVYQESFTANGAVFVSRHFTKIDATSVLDELMSAPEGPFNILAIPPRPPQQSKTGKGVTLLDLLIAEGKVGSNYLGQNIEAVISNGAPLRYENDDVDLIACLNERRRIARNSNPAMIIDQGGSAETLFNFCSCESAGRDPRFHGLAAMHLTPWTNIIEVVDPSTGSHVSHLQRGVLVVTALRAATRYIRYLVGDSAIYLDPQLEPCKCGRTTPRIIGIRREFEPQRLQMGCAGG